MAAHNIKTPVIRLPQPLPPVAAYPTVLYQYHMSTPRKTPAGYKVTVRIGFSKVNCIHTCINPDRATAERTALAGAIALAESDIELREQYKGIRLEDPVRDAAWIMNHLESENPLLKNIAREAYKTLSEGT